MDGPGDSALARERRDTGVLDGDDPRWRGDNAAATTTCHSAGTRGINIAGSGLPSRLSSLVTGKTEFWGFLGHLGTPAYPRVPDSASRSSRRRRELLIFMAHT
jgi:hypothetical protein